MGTNCDLLHEKRADEDLEGRREFGSDIELNQL
jgi:hypothetical protein